MVGTRMSRLVIVGACLAALVMMVFISIEPQTQYTVDEVMSSPQEGEDKEETLERILDDLLDDDSPFHF